MINSPLDYRKSIKIISHLESSPRCSRFLLCPAVLHHYHLSGDLIHTASTYSYCMNEIHNSKRVDANYLKRKCEADWVAVLTYHHEELHSWDKRVYIVHHILHHGLASSACFMDWIVTKQICKSLLTTGNKLTTPTKVLD